MTLQKARELGHACGLETDEECIRNVELHAVSLFEYKEIQKELAELHKEYYGGI